MLHNRDSLFTQKKQIFIFVFGFLQNQGVQNLNGMFEVRIIMLSVTV